MINATATTQRLENIAPRAFEESSLFDFLAAIFAVLDQAEINYAILRGYEELASAHDHLEVDLLVAPEDLSRLAASLARKGFIEQPNWGHAPHHFFLGFDQASGSWLKFDVVCELCYGAPVRALRVNLAKECLQQRQRRDPVYVLAPEHELLTLLLHGLLDKKTFREARRARVLELFETLQHELNSSRRCQELVDKKLAPALTWNELQHLLAREDWQGLLKKHSAVAQRLQQGQGASVLWRKLKCHTLRRLRPLLFALRARGIFIALLAPDGAGKSTLAQALKKDFGLKAQLIYMGTNLAASTIGLPSTRWLHRVLKKSRAPKIVKLLLKPVNYCNRILDLWYRIAYAHGQRLRGRVVVFDRYVYDSWIAKPATTWAKRMRRKLLQAGWPSPDLVLLLDAPGELLFRRKGEHSPEWLEQQRQAYLALQSQLPQMRTLDAMMSAEEVRRAAIALIWEKAKSGLRK
jgi:thymidylate kinase